MTKTKNGKARVVLFEVVFDGTADAARDVAVDAIEVMVGGFTRPRPPATEAPMLAEPRGRKGDR